MQPPSASSDGVPKSNGVSKIFPPITDFELKAAVRLLRGEADRLRELFMAAAGTSPTVSQSAAMSFFSRSELPDPVLLEIWGTCDRGSKDHLTRPEFILAVRLISLAKAGYEPSLEQLKAAQFDLPIPDFEVRGGSAGAPVQPAMGGKDDGGVKGDIVNQPHSQGAAVPLIANKEETIKAEGNAADPARMENDEMSKGTRTNQADAKAPVDDNTRNQQEEENARAEVAAAAARKSEEEERIKAEEEGRRQIEEEKLRKENAAKYTKVEAEDAAQRQREEENARAEAAAAAARKSEEEERIKAEEEGRKIEEERLRKENAAKAEAEDAAQRHQEEENTRAEAAAAAARLGKSEEEERIKAEEEGRRQIEEERLRKENAAKAEAEDAAQRHQEEENARAEAAAAAARKSEEEERIKAEEEGRRKIEEDSLKAQAAEDAAEAKKKKEEAEQAAERERQRETFLLPNAIEDAKPPHKDEAISTVVVPKKSLAERVGDATVPICNAVIKVGKDDGAQLHQLREDLAQGERENWANEGLVPGALTTILPKEEIAKFVEAGITAIDAILGTSQALFPVLSPILAVVKTFVSLVDRKNKIDIKMRRMTPSINKAIIQVHRVLQLTKKNVDVLMPHIKNVQDTIEEIVQLFNQFFKKGYFRKLIQKVISPTILDDLDNRLMRAVTDLALEASVEALSQLQEKENPEIVQRCQDELLGISALQRAMMTSSGGVEDVTKCTPAEWAQFAKFAQMCGMTEHNTREEMKLIQKEHKLGVEFVTTAMAGFHQKIDDLCERFQSLKEDMRRENEHELQKIRKEMQKMHNQAEKSQLGYLAVETKVDALTTKLGNGLHNVTKLVERLLSQPQQGANSSVKDLAFSSKKVSVKLGQLAQDFQVQNFVDADWVFHSCGVGGKLPYLNGMNGASGLSGEMMRVSGSGADGKDGMIGELGSPGVDCADFKVGILVQTVENRKFAYISHSGQKGKTSILEITHDVFIFVQGRGGNGGAGGKGGDGEPATQPGGKGGRAAKGGQGGPGGKGARVLISTDDPLLLMRLVVDCTGGRGGVGGFRGNPGGVGPGPNGRAGKVPQEHALNGNPGESGSVAFQILQKADLQVASVGTDTASTVVTSERRLSTSSLHSGTSNPDVSGVLEFGAEPYRLIFHAEEEEEEEGGNLQRTRYGSTVQDIPAAVKCDVSRGGFVYDWLSPTKLGTFIFGEEVVVGPYKPTNCGSLHCPESKLEACLMNDDFEVIDSQVSEAWGVIKPATDLKYGRCEQEGRELKLRLRSWEAWDVSHDASAQCSCAACAIKQAAEVLPFPEKGSASTRAEAWVEAWFSVDGLPFVPYKEVLANGDEVEEVTKILTKLTVDLPMRLGRLSDGKAMKVPQLMSISNTEDPSIPIEVSLVFYAPFSQQDYQFGLRCYADGFEPMLTVEGGKQTSTVAGVRHINLTYFAITVAEVKHTEQREWHFSLTLPKGEHVAPGKIISLRPELRKRDPDGDPAAVGMPVVSYGACSQIRLTPPPPSTASAGQNQVVLFTNRYTRQQDYVALESCCAFLGLHAAFLDIERFRDAHGRVDWKYWEVQKRTATLVWVPEQVDVLKVPKDQLLEHVRGGGGLVTNLDMEQLPASLRVVRKDQSVSLGFSDADSQESISIRGQVVGPAVWPLVSALIRSRTPSQQLELLSQRAQQMVYRVGRLVAPSFRVDKIGGPCCSGLATGCDWYEPDVGCGAPRFRPGPFYYQARPIGNTPVTVKDALVCHYTANLKQERWTALNQQPAQPSSRRVRTHHPFTDAFLQRAKQPSSPQEAAMLLGMMEASSLQSWTDVCDRDIADYNRTPNDGCCFGLCEAVRMCRDTSDPFLDIKIAWLTLRKKATVEEAMAETARTRAVGQALDAEYLRTTNAERARRRNRLGSTKSDSADCQWLKDTEEFFLSAFD